MVRTVVFLGAGASKALGLPLTNEILPSLLGRLAIHSPDHGELFRGNRRAADHLNRCLEAILPGLRDFLTDSRDRGRWEESLPPITDVLSAIDYFLLSGNLPGAGLTPHDVDRSRRLLERGIFELLVGTEGLESPDSPLRMEGVPEPVSEEWRKST